MKDADPHTIRIAKEANEELQQLVRPFFLQRSKSGAFKSHLSQKDDIVVWTHLSNKQREMYNNYLKQNGRIDMILQGEKASALEEITWLKKLCGHPLLCEGIGNMEKRSPESLLNDSAKLKILVDLVKKFVGKGNRCLIFSQSTQVLDIISSVIGFTRVERIDGKTKAKDRQILIDKFNTSSKIKVMLLSTKAAGVGESMMT